jgi:hypothetical protein
MRLLICAIFLGVTLSAQTPPPSAEKPKTEDQGPKAEGQPAEPKPSPEQSEAMRRALERLQRKMREAQAATPSSKPGGIVLAPNQPCAIPLKNVLRPESNPDPRMPGSQIPKTPPDAKGSIKEAQAPAPSCDDVKK